MASVTGGSLALTDARVRVKAHVAGIAMGRIKEGNRFAVRPGILLGVGHLGHRDFKAAATDQGGEAAKKRIHALTADVEVGKIYEGPVLRLLDFGAIVQLMPGRDGLLHISQISQERVNAVSDHLKEGQIVKVKVLEADDKGRVRLSMKAVHAQEQAAKQNA